MTRSEIYTKLVGYAIIALATYGTYSAVGSGRNQSDVKLRVSLEADPYDEQVEAFKAAAVEEQVDIPSINDTKFLMSDDLPDKTLGQCHMDQNVIIFNANTWGGLSHAEKEFVVWHELGHCVLHRDHNPDFMDGRPKSIMYKDSTIARDDYYYWTHHKALQHELFHPGQYSVDNPE